MASSVLPSSTQRMRSGSQPKVASPTPSLVKPPAPEVGEVREAEAVGMRETEPGLEATEVPGAVRVLEDSGAPAVMPVPVAPPMPAALALVPGPTGLRGLVGFVP